MNLTAHTPAFPLHSGTFATAAARPWTLTPLGGARHELKLWGKLPPRWLANLTSGLSSRGLNVERGYANKISPTVWQGTFELASSGPFPASLEFSAMAQEAQAGTEASIRLDSFSVRPQGEALYVEVCGEDTVGFLMTLLKLFSFYSLYPAEVSIDTPAGRVHDRFWLKGLAGATPSAEVCDTLQAELAKFVAKAA